MNRRDFVGGMAAGAVVAAGVRVSLATDRILGANDRIRIGLIGAGDRGQQDLKDALRQHNVECVAIADVYSRRRDQARKIARDAQAFDDPMRLLERNDVDAVIIATPLHLHATHMLAALAGGKDVYCEKTMTWSIAEAAACRKAAEDSKQVIQIGLQHESDGDFADARKWIQDGLLGKVNLVEAWMSRNTPHGHGQWVRPVPGDCNPDHVNWKLFLNDRPSAGFDGHKFINWRLYWEFSGGNVTENMVHQIAWIQTALGLDAPLAATMSGGVFSEKDGRQVPDTIAVTLEYPDLVVLWQSTFGNSRYGLGERILGSDGTIEHVSGSTDMIIGKYTSGIRYLPEGTNRPHGTNLSGQTASQDHMANWMECIRSRNKKTNAPVEVGYNSAIAAHMANLAYRQQRRLTFTEAAAVQPSY